MADRYQGAQQWDDDTTVIGRGMVFEGEIQAKAAVVIGGRVSGKIDSESMVKVLLGGVVQGPITAESVMIEGAVDGDVTVQDQFELGASGRVRGDVAGARLAVAEGAYMQGRMRATEGSVKRFREQRHTV
jgi:cytoskeletal protein CcmA (bactofilin family)